MFQTATVTDLRFKTKDILKRVEKAPVWIFKKGQKKAVIMNIGSGESLLQKWENRISFNQKERKGPKKSILDEIKKMQFKGPKDLSSRIDEIVYG